MTSCLKRNVNVYTEATPECATYVKLDTHTHTHTHTQTTHVGIMLWLSSLIHVTHMHTHTYS